MLVAMKFNVSQQEFSLAVCEFACGKINLDWKNSLHFVCLSFGLKSYMKVTMRGLSSILVLLL